jgi:hypothetical protein
VFRSRGLIVAGESGRGKSKVEVVWRCLFCCGTRMTFKKAVLPEPDEDRLLDKYSRGFRGRLLLGSTQSANAQGLATPWNVSQRSEGKWLC